LKTIDIIVPFHRINDFLFESIDAIKNSESVKPRIILSNDSHVENNKLPAVLQKLSVVKAGEFSGFPNAVNSARRLLENAYTTIVASDDLVDRQKLSKQINSLSSDYDISICEIEKINDRGKIIRSANSFPSYRTYDPSWLLFGPYGADGTWVAKTDWWLRNVNMPLGPFHDWELALKVLPVSRVVALNESLIFYRMHSSQTSRTFDLKSITALQSFYQTWTRVNENYGLPILDFSNMLAVTQPWYSPKNVSLDRNQIDRWLEAWILRCNEKRYDLHSSLYLKWMYLRFQRNLPVKLPLSRSQFVFQSARLTINAPALIGSYIRRREV